MSQPDQIVFKNGSTTYYWSSRFFPKKIRDDVMRLYGFLLVADTYADKQPGDPKKLLELNKQYDEALTNHAYDATVHSWDEADEQTVKNIVRLTHKYKFEPAWVQAFLAAMKSDLQPKKFKTLDDTLKYVYGSAEVIGLMVAKLVTIPEEAYEAAQLQGRAMQWINFVRDIEADNKLGRLYFPLEDLQKCGLESLSREEAEAKPKQFQKFIKLQLDRYAGWQAEAEKSFGSIPRRIRIPLQSAVEMYNWTAQKIAKNPMIIYEKQLKPTKRRVLLSTAKNSFKR